MWGRGRGVGRIDGRWEGMEVVCSTRQIWFCRGTDASKLTLIRKSTWAFPYSMMIFLKAKNRQIVPIACIGCSSISQYPTSGTSFENSPDMNPSEPAKYKRTNIKLGCYNAYSLHHLCLHCPKLYYSLARSSNLIGQMT